MTIKFIHTIALLTTFALASCSNAKSDQTKPQAYALKVTEDVNYLCDLIPGKYVYFQPRKNSWREACEHARVDALSVVDKQGALILFERLMDALYDPHASLGTNSGQSPRLVPSGTDLWVEWDGQDLHVVAVRQNGGAAKAGVMVGDIITSIHGQNPKDVARDRLRTDQNNISDKRMNWAMNVAIAGYRHKDRVIMVRRNDEEFTFKLGNPYPATNVPPITSRIVNPHIGYIRFNNSLGNSNAIKEFEKAMENMKGVKAWIIDLRDTPGGGNTDVAEPILGRFIKDTRAYQQIVEPNKTPYNRKAFPRGPWTAQEPVVVLVGRWTGSMGEGMAIGFDGMERGLVIGSTMAGLAGGTNRFTLPGTKIPVGFPTYDLRHLDGTPRHQWQPSVNILADNGSGNDDALDRAILAAAE